MILKFNEFVNEQELNEGLIDNIKNTYKKYKTAILAFKDSIAKYQSEYAEIISELIDNDTPTPKVEEKIKAINKILVKEVKVAEPEKLLKALVPTAKLESLQEELKDGASANVFVTSFLMFVLSLAVIFILFMLKDLGAVAPKIAVAVSKIGSITAMFSLLTAFISNVINKHKTA